MSKVHAIKRRIRSVGKIEQITKAMEKVAASKMRRAQEAALRSRPYAHSAREALARLVLLTSPKDHPLFHQRTMTKRLLILFSSDRGLAGAYNSNIAKLLLETLKDEIKTDVIVIGQKGAQFVSKLGKLVEVVGVYTNWPTTPTSQDVRPLVDTAIAQFTGKTVDSVELLYTDFVSSLRQVAVRRPLLPINQVEKGSIEVMFEPSPAAVLNFIVPRLIEVQVYQASLEAIASEQSMRMLAMKNASDNAEELVDDLTLTYNGARQGAITQELAEITAGAEALL